MSKKTVAAKRTATAKAKPATVSDHLQRLVQAMPEPPEAPPARGESVGARDPQPLHYDMWRDRFDELHKAAGANQGLVIPTLDFERAQFGLAGVLKVIDIDSRARSANEDFEDKDKVLPLWVVESLNQAAIVMCENMMDSHNSLLKACGLPQR